MRTRFPYRSSMHKHVTKYLQLSLRSLLHHSRACNSPAFLHSAILLCVCGDGLRYRISSSDLRYPDCTRRPLRDRSPTQGTIFRVQVLVIPDLRHPQCLVPQIPCQSLYASSKVQSLQTCTDCHKSGATDDQSSSTFVFPYLVWHRENYSHEALSSQTGRDFGKPRRAGPRVVLQQKPLGECRVFEINRMRCMSFSK